MNLAWAGEGKSPVMGLRQHGSSRQHDPIQWVTGHRASLPLSPS